MRKWLGSLSWPLVLLLAGCMQHVMHQGNVLKPDLVRQIGQGDTRFRVETLLGTPMLQGSIHPHHVIYVEDYRDPDSGEKYRRRVDIVYDDAWRVSRITRTGFAKQAEE